jgi:succinyl-diaminopimelate desuccinylase
VGEGWDTPPFSAVVEDRMIYGRGAADDKGPAVAALYALKAVKDLNIPLKYNTSLILGTAEETGSPDIKYYLEHRTPPPNVFSPDGEFPVVNIEKGGLHVSFFKDWDESKTLPRIRSIKGGKTGNVIPAQAEAIIEGISAELVGDICDRAGKTTGAVFSIDRRDGALILTARGKSEHASTPEKGCNAITAILSVLAKISFAESDSFSTVKAINQLFPHGDYYGKAIGIAQSDELSGPLTLSFNIMEQTTTGFRGYFDSRTPLCTTRENSFDIVEKKFKQLGIGMESRITPPHHTPCDSEFVEVMLKAYEQYTGNKGYCEGIGGGTYVHNIDGGVCFGACMPGFEAYMHGSNERIPIEDLITSAKIFTQVIIDICG